MSKHPLGKWFPALISAAVLAVFAVIGSALVGYSYQGTAERIEENERQALLDLLGQIVPQARYNNDMLSDTIKLQGVAELGGQPVTVYRARRNGEDVAAIFSPVVTPGYAGKMSLIVGVYSDGKVAGVRVLTHHETPGLGDKLEIERSNWITGFDGRSIGNPPLERWSVKRDGGEFDQFTGATITPRQATGAVKRTLLYFAHNQNRLFQAKAQANAQNIATGHNDG